MNHKATGLLASLIAAFTVAASVPAVASAVSMTLPVFSGTATRFIGNSGATKLTVEGGASISCTKGSSEGTFGANRSEGPGSVTFTECREGGIESLPCKSLAGTAGSVTSTGTWQLVLKLDGTSDLHYLTFSRGGAGLHIECPGGAVLLFLIIGKVLAGIAQKTASTFTLSIKSSESRQEFSEYENNSGTLVKVSLKVSLEGGKAKAAFGNAEESLLEFRKCDVDRKIGRAQVVSDW
jgi:hypothetical protein